MALAVTSVTATSGSSVNIPITLTRTDTNAGVPNCTVSISVNSIAAGTVTTDSNGNAVLVYQIPAGTQAGTEPTVATFAGNGSNAAASGNGTLTVTAIPTSLVVPNVTANIGATVTLTTILTRTDTNAGIAGESIVFAVNGTSVGTATTASTGNCYLNLFAASRDNGWQRNHYGGIRG